MIRKAALVVSLALSLLCTAEAQASLELDGGPTDLAHSIQDVTLYFTAAVDALRSQVRVFGPDGEIPVGDVYQGPKVDELVAPIEMELQPGVYLVHFIAYSTDGHVLRGSSTLIVPEPAPLARHLVKLPSR